MTRDLHIDMETSESVGSINPWEMYTAEEVRQRLHFRKVDTVYGIPEHDLPRHRRGPRGGAIRYLGADIICYMLGYPPPDHKALRARLEEQLRESVELPKLRNKNASNLVRVL